MRRCPRLGAYVLAELCLAPRARKHPLAVPIADTPIDLRAGKRRVRVHAYGEGPLVLLVHGWQGGAWQLSSLATSICAAGFRVALFDMPAHGEAAGWSTSAPEFIRVLSDVARALGPVHAVVGHSLGGSVALLSAARGLSMAGVVALSPVPSFEFTLRGYARAYGLPPHAQEALARRFEARTRMKRDELDLDGITPGVPTLLVHDLLDRRVPSRYSRKLKERWPGTHLVETCGFGHGRMLDADLVAQSVVAFLAMLPPPGVAPNPARPDART
ncbi:MAG TPA: alpha/beta fold hydrolase [Polyangiaceae bacterium]|nr:alpha/beta fold hydrolase [Polyangiaceae bacterium]